MDRVLIVDDSPFDRRMIRKAIESNAPDIVFTEVESGLDVEGVIAAQAPDIAIVDIRMPGMDGFEVLQKIRSNSKLPVLMVSGSEQPEDRANADAGGADGYFVKPPSLSAYFSLGREIYDRYLCCRSG
jgi:two-component system KDP operon response regulator KdpE